MQTVKALGLTIFNTSFKFLGKVLTAKPMTQQGFLATNKDKKKCFNNLCKGQPDNPHIGWNKSI